jgi:iron complex outermembrane receptor protein
MLNNKKQSGRKPLLKGASFLAAAAAAVSATPAVAQDGEEIVVTGSRIARQDLVANSPVTTVSDQELQLSGALSVESILNELPQVVPSFGSSSNNPGNNGQATVDLRGLGNLRTLVLVDGRRLAPSDKAGTVDLNLIPATMVERVEVVTGGASAVYGSDALAGVVNFILQDDFEGVEIGGNAGISGEGDASEWAMDITAGGNFANGRGNATIFASYLNRESLLGTEREFSRETFGPSSRIPSGTIENNVLNPFACSLEEEPGLPCNGSGTRININTEGTGGGAPGGYNFAPTNFIQLPADRIVLGGFATYDLNDDVEGYMQTLFADSRTSVQLAPTPLASTNGITIPAARALALLEDQDTQDAILGRPNADAPLLIQRRMLEFGPRIQEFDKKFYQTTLGARGDLDGSGNWSWDTYYSYARSDMYDSLFGDVSSSRLQQALNGCLPGAIEGCTALDPFGEGSISADQVNWLKLDNVTDHHTYEQEILSASITGDAFNLPAGPVGVAVGIEYRSDSLSFVPAPASLGDIVGFNAVQPTAGSTEVHEIYGEAIVPLVADAPFAQAINLELGGRLSHYDSVGQIETYKIGGEWQLIDSFRLRTMYNVATRAPSVFELFQAGDQGFPNYGEPCEGLSPGDQLFDFCAGWLGLDPNAPGTAATLATFQQSDSQVETFNFGNPNLEPEESETLTVGFVWQQDTNFGRWTATVDYYDIQITNFIDTPAANLVIARCVATLDLTSPECLATPRISSGQLGGLLVPIENTPGDGIQTSGYDVTLGWSNEVGPGTLDINLIANFLDQYLQDGGIVNGGDYTGHHIGVPGGAFPEIRTNMRTTYTYNDWQFSWQWEHIGEMDDYGYSALYGYPMIDAIDYHDFSIRWFATENLDFTAVCENCMDQEPQDNTASGYFAGLDVDNSVYDGLGRYFRLGVRARF